MSDVRPLTLARAGTPAVVHRPLLATGRAAVVAHRGASAEMAEHTLDAYRLAIESGADALECDVRLTRDEHLVCVHDRTVNRTSDGRGAVSALDLTSLEALDFASWHAAQWGTSGDDLLGRGGDPYLEGVVPDRSDGGGLLTLEALLGLVHDADRDVRLLIETKHPTRYGGLVEKTLVEQLARFGWAGRPGPPASLRHPVDPDSRVIVMSFAPTAVRRIRLLAPDLPTVLLMHRLLPVRREGVLPAGVTIAGTALDAVRTDPRFVERAHRRGHPVFVFTVDDTADVEFLLDLGVDTIITNRPNETLATVLARAGTARA